MMKLTGLDRAIATKWHPAVQAIPDGTLSSHALEPVDISNNIGDSHSLVTHPSSTTYGLSADGWAAMGSKDGMLRLSLGQEDPLDAIEDFDCALKVVHQ